MYSSLKLLLGMVMFSLLCVVFSCSMFAMVALKEAQGAMGAPEQTPKEKKLSECKTNKECKPAYDAIYGKGAWAKMEKIYKNCSEYSYNCDLGINWENDEIGTINEGE
jgi:hypothetical protein